jgi:hypothetical protein
VTLTWIWLGPVLTVVRSQPCNKTYTHKFDLSSFFYERSCRRQAGIIPIRYQ